MEFTIKLDDYAPSDVIDALEEQLKFSMAGTFDKREGEDEAYFRAKTILERYRPAATDQPPDRLLPASA